MIECRVLMVWMSVVIKRPGEARNKEISSLFPGGEFVHIRHMSIVADVYVPDGVDNIKAMVAFRCHR